MMRTGNMTMISMLLCFGTPWIAQHNSMDSLMPEGVSIAECPPGLLPFLDKDLLQSKVALFVFNNSLHPLGKTEFRDNKTVVAGTQTRFRMNRFTLLYVDTGTHQFHTIYQRLFKKRDYHPGGIYFAELYSRTTWPVGFPVIKNKKGVKEEYGPVLLRYIDKLKAEELWKKFGNKEVIVNR